MRSDELVKVVFEDNKDTKVIKGYILDEDEFTFKIKTLSDNEFPSQKTREYYGVIRELISAIIFLEGYKVYGEGSHQLQIKYFASQWKINTLQEIQTIEELRKRFKVRLRTRGIKKYATVSFLPDNTTERWENLRRATTEVWPDAYVTSACSMTGATFRLNPES